MPVERLKQNRDMLMVAGIFAVLATIADMFRDTVGFSCNPIYLVHVLGHIAFFYVAFMLGDYLIDRSWWDAKVLLTSHGKTMLDGLTTCATWRSLASRRRTHLAAS